MEDVQSRQDGRGIQLDRVGIRGLSVPALVDGAPTIVSASLSVSIVAEAKGAHMSRFIEVLERHRKDLSLGALPSLLSDIQSRLEAPAAQVELRFPFFQDRAAPVSGATAVMEMQGRLAGEVDASSGMRLEIEAEVPVSSLCPCSKEISDYGAHNQRGYVTIRVVPRKVGDRFAPMPLHDLVAVAEAHASSPLYPILKRPDERHVTMRAYDNPAFVEDMTRGVAATLKEDPRVQAFWVRAINQESIHNHDAFAEVHWER